MTFSWRKSSFSSGSQQCVELAAGDDHLLIRDSKHPEDGHLTINAAPAAAFLADIKAGRFDGMI
jgi:hypothetical protein